MSDAGTAQGRSSARGTAILAFKVLASNMTKEGGEIDPKDLHVLGKMMKDLMSSSGIREKLMTDARAEAARAAREEAASEVEQSAAALGLTGATVDGIKQRILFGGA